MEAVIFIAALHGGGQLEHLSHRQGLLRRIPVAAHTGGQPHIVGDIHPYRKPVPGRHIAEIGQLAPGQRKPGGGHPLLHQDAGQLKHRDLGNLPIAGQGKDPCPTLLCDGGTVIDQIVKQIGGSPLSVGERQNTGHTPAGALLHHIEAAIQGQQRAVFRLDQVSAVRPDHTQLSIQIDGGQAHGEGYHTVVFQGDHYPLLSVHKAPLAVILTLGQSLAVAPYHGSLGGGQSLSP